MDPQPGPHLAVLGASSSVESVIEDCRVENWPDLLQIQIMLSIED